MKVDDVKKCSFQNWYSDFKKVTIKSIILPLPDEFVSYILKDGIVLPKNSGFGYSVPANDSDTESDNDTEETWEDNEEDEPEAPEFLDFDNSIKDAIETLDGKVFPKLNWSSPRDASWIAFNNSCCCTTVSDIYLLLKGSNFITHDLTQSYMLCEDFNELQLNNSESTDQKEKFYLVLRRWTEIDPSGEFRCFVQNGVFIGISQREHSLYFDHIDHHKDAIVEDIVNFYQHHIQSKFPCDNYIFDVYRKTKEKVYLIDFNPFGVVTESLLFSWDELNGGLIKPDGSSLPEFRYVENDRGVQPSSLSHHAIPRDIIDISSGEDSFKLVDLLKLKIEEQNKAHNDDSDEEWKVFDERISFFSSTT
ncbi:cell division cycle protein 123 homolog [Trichonephila clavata]|uniref:Cell division cycle protein 123 homolog n=1 Tax=Trichonephila clavata TaxID=2740835 RepID=A0A8X6L2H1_TRICU|nr:cell division cycle protein 123 homolog [Trichonephila clavata]